jgi:hypothetical protein
MSKTGAKIDDCEDVDCSYNYNTKCRDNRH